MCRTIVVQEKIVDQHVAEVSRSVMDLNEEDLTLWRLCAGNIFAPIGFLYVREAIAKVGSYREDLPVQGDWKFNLRFMQEGRHDVSG